MTSATRGPGGSGSRPQTSPPPPMCVCVYVRFSGDSRWPRAHLGKLVRRMNNAELVLLSWQGKRRNFTHGPGKLSQCICFALQSVSGMKISLLRIYPSGSSSFSLPSRARNVPMLAPAAGKCDTTVIPDRWDYYDRACGFPHVCALSWNRSVWRQLAAAR